MRSAQRSRKNCLSTYYTPFGGHGCSADAHLRLVCKGAEGSQAIFAVKCCICGKSMAAPCVNANPFPCTHSSMPSTILLMPQDQVFDMTRPEIETGL